MSIDFMFQLNCQHHEFLCQQIYIKQSQIHFPIQWGLPPTLLLFRLCSDKPRSEIHLLTTQLLVMMSSTVDVEHRIFVNIVNTP